MLIVLSIRKCSATLLYKFVHDFAMEGQRRWHRNCSLQY